MLIWLSIGLLAGMLLTFAFATILYAFSRISRAGVGMIAILLTLGTIVGFFTLMLSQSRYADAGGIFAQLIFAMIAVALGGPTGLLLFCAALNGIEHRKGSAIQDR